MKTIEITTIENNKMIAEFMGFEKAIVRSTEGVIYDYDLPQKFELIKETMTTIESEFCEILMEQDHCMVKDLKFNTDWNWLMSVVEKIESLGFRTEIITKDNGFNSCEFYNKSINGGYSSQCSKIEATYRAVVDFIKWYNLNNQKNEK